MAERFRSSLASIVIVIFLSSFKCYAQNQTTFLHAPYAQFYVVPPGIDTIHIECWGAQGGQSSPPANSIGGKGAYITGYFAVTPGDTLTLIIGAKGHNGGSPGSNTGGGGGGATFVYKQTNTGNTPLIIAAGGGGGSYQPNNTSIGQPGQATMNAGGGTYAPATPGQGGITDNSMGGGNGGGGCGWFSNGMGNNWCTPSGAQGSSPGLSFFSPDPLCDGGYAGGGAGYNGGGGGAGYTGGGGGGWSTGGGGGGSYNTGVNQINIAGLNNGHGQVVITENCVPMNVSVSSTSVCLGDPVILNAISSFGGTISWTGGITNGNPFIPPAGNTTYTATSSNYNDCPYFANVQVNPLPNVQANGDTTEFCFQSTQVTLYGSGASTYWWSNGVSDGIAFDPPEGSTVYTVTGIDDMTGCMNIDSILILASKPTPNYVVDPETFGLDGVIDLTVSNGKAPYQFDWSNDGTGDWDDNEDIWSLSAGTYNVSIKDALGCIETGSVNVYSVMGIDDQKVLISLYPNPAQDFIKLRFNGQFQYSVFDLNGKTIIVGAAADEATLNIQILPAGQYLIVLKENGNAHPLEFNKL